MSRPPCAIQIGVTGHQARPGIDWDWIAAQTRNIFEQHKPVARVFSCLAAGTDQVFAREALAHGIPATAVIPMSDYERHFRGDDLAQYKRLVEQCERFLLPGAASDEEAFFAAGRYVVDSVDLLVAVWDGKPSAGLGGTGDVVRYALSSGQMVMHIDPILRTIRSLRSEPPGSDF